MPLPVQANPEFLADALHGLAQPQKSLPGKYLWDETGSLLFDRICATADYYPTRHEVALLTALAPRLAPRIGPHATVVELGSGAAHKVRILLDALPQPRRYLALDIAPGFLQQAVARLAADYPHLEVVPVVADYTRPITLPAFRRDGTVLGFHPGTSIGTFDAAGVRGFLGRVRDAIAPGFLLLGADPNRNAASLRRAYGDADGLMPRFHLHVLERLRDELGAAVDPAGFRHEARVLDDPPRVEAHLVAQGPQHIRLAGHDIRLAPGESIRTDHSYKYPTDVFENLARDAGWTPVETAVDRDGRGAFYLLTAR